MIGAGAIRKGAGWPLFLFGEDNVHFEEPRGHAP